MKIAVLHRYPPSQVIGTNASFIEFLKILSKKNYIYYLTYQEKFDIYKNVKFISIPLKFNRGNYFDKIIKTWIWIIISPFYVKYLEKKFKITHVYCDDSVPLYGYFIKIVCPNLKVIIRLGDLQTGYLLSENYNFLFKISQVVETFMWSKVDGIVSISNAFKNYILSRGIHKNKVHVVEESIDLSTSCDIKRKKTKNITFLFHGSLLKCKGVETLIAAFKNVKLKYPQIKLVIAGGGGEEKKLKYLVKKLNIKDVESTGWYNHKMLGEKMSTVDIGIVMRSTNMANNFVVTTCLLENWKYKKPVIAPNLESFKSVIKHGKNGLIFTAGSTKSLEEKMIYLIKNRRLWSKLGESGYKKAKELFDSRKIAYKMSRVISSI